MAGEVATL